MLLVIALAIFLVFVVLAVQYESLLNPFVILAAIPLSMMGVITILLVTGTPFSAPVILGMILLAGIVVNNSILLVEFAEGFRRRGGALDRRGGDRGGRGAHAPDHDDHDHVAGGHVAARARTRRGGELMRPLAIAVVGRARRPRRCVHEQSG
jgi:hypothetical protein